MNVKQLAALSMTSAALLPAASANGVTILDMFAGPAAGPSAGGAPTDLGGGTYGYSLDFTSQFSAAGTSKLIMVYSSKDESGNGVSSDYGGAPVTSVTYDGVELQTAIYNFDDASLSRVTVGIYYLDNPISDGLLRIELGDQYQTEYGLGLYAVDGLAPGVTDAQTTAGSGDIAANAAVTVNAPTGFVVQEAARNNQSLSGDPGDDWETLYNYPGPQSYRGLSQYQVTSAPGEYFAPINNTGSFKRISAASFDGIIPEPASVVLLGFGALLVSGRRRRV